MKLEFNDLVEINSDGNYNGSPFEKGWKGRVLKINDISAHVEMFEMDLGFGIGHRWREDKFLGPGPGSIMYWIPFEYLTKI